MTADAMTLAARYLESVVEELQLCPYARPACRAGRRTLEERLRALRAQPDGESTA